MRDLKTTRVDPTAADDNSPSDASMNAAIAMIDEGNALEELGRTSEAMARYEAAAHAEPDAPEHI